MATSYSITCNTCNREIMGSMVRGEDNATLLCKVLEAKHKLSWAIETLEKLEVEPYMGWYMVCGVQINHGILARCARNQHDLVVMSEYGQTYSVPK